jgi:hypothetical protein
MFMASMLTVGKTKALPVEDGRRWPRSPELCEVRHRCRYCDKDGSISGVLRDKLHVTNAQRDLVQTLLVTL